MLNGVWGKILGKWSARGYKKRRKFFVTGIMPGKNLYSFMIKRSLQNNSLWMLNDQLHRVHVVYNLPMVNGRVVHAASQVVV